MTRPYYHGTRRGFGRGGWVFPRTVRRGPGTTMGISGTLAGDEGDYVYVTTDRALAETFAYAAPGRGRPEVLTVAPVGTLVRDPATYEGEEMAAWRCDYARVVTVEPLATRGQESG